MILRPACRSLAAATLAALVLALPAALADPGRPHGGDRGDRGDRGVDRGAVHMAMPGPRMAAPGARMVPSFPARGSVVGALPRGGVEVNHLNHRYFYHGGTWYAPSGPRWVVVMPPLGVYVPWLPGFYSTFWWGGMPYFWANDVYYAWREPRRAYEVVAAPEGAPPPQPAAEDLYVYPKNGQSTEQQAQDRYECHRWSADQTHFDPTRVGGGVNESDAPVRRAEYFRAMGACLEGRGYSVK